MADIDFLVTANDALIKARIAAEAIVTQAGSYKAAADRLANTEAALVGTVDASRRRIEGTADKIDLLALESSKLIGAVADDLGVVLEAIEFVDGPAVISSLSEMSRRLDSAIERITAELGNKIVSELSAALHVVIQQEGKRIDNQLVELQAEMHVRFDQFAATVRSVESRLATAESNHEGLAKQVSDLAERVESIDQFVRSRKGISFWR